MLWPIIGQIFANYSGCFTLMPSLRVITCEDPDISPETRMIFLSDANKMLSYRRETAMQCWLVMAKSRDRFVQKAVGVLPLPFPLFSPSRSLPFPSPFFSPSLPLPFPSLLFSLLPSPPPSISLSPSRFPLFP